jgi:quercetin dioxygenase-like cupin family protein
MEENMASSVPSTIDLNAEVAKLVMCRRTPRSTPADRKGSVAQLASYRDGLLLAIKFSGTDHWERHLTGDELIHVLDGSATLEIVCDDGPPRSFELRAGTVALIPRGAWHRFHSSEGATEIAVTPFPGETIELDVDDPRTVGRAPAGLSNGVLRAAAGPTARKATFLTVERKMPAIIDINAEAAKLRMFLGRTPLTTFAERMGSAARLGTYREGMLLLNKSAGKGHWETHPEDELVYVLDGALTLDIVEQDTVRSFELGAGMMVIVPPGAWHRVLSLDGATTISLTIPGDHIDLDVGDPRAVEDQAIRA